MKELLAAVREGRKQAVPELVAGLDRAGRRAALAELKSLRKEARGWDWQQRAAVQNTLLVAGAGCHTGAAACAAWIGSRDLRDWSSTPYPLVLKVLADRDPAWLADLAHRLAARPSMASTDADYRFVAELVRIAQCPMPVTDTIVEAWLSNVGSSRWHGNKRNPLIEILRADPHLTTMVPRLFEGSEPPSTLYWYDDPDCGDHWPAALATLAAEGGLDRAVLVDGAVKRLLRGGKPGSLRFYLAVVRALGLTEEEENARVPDWSGMAGDGIPIVAGHAQEVLSRLDARGELTTRVLAEVSGSVLFRTEKKLVRTQLILIGKVLRRDASTADELLPVVAEAFGHEDMDIQERALKLTARHLRSAGEAVREDLAVAAAQLGPMHRAAAHEVFGDLLDEGPAEEPYEEALPPVPAARLVGPAPGTVAELVEEVAALVNSGSREAGSFERALDGLIRHARTDRTALTEALREAMAGQWWLDDLRPEQVDRWFTRNPGGLDLVAASLLGRISFRSVHDGRNRWTAAGTCPHAALDGVMYARLWEAAAFATTGQVPFLLATPTWHTGSLDADELVERLRAYRRLGVRPGPADFAQALLRVRRTDSLRAAADAALLGTTEGDRLASWLRADTPVAPVLRHRSDSDRPTSGTWWQRSATGTRRVLLATKERLDIQQEFPRAFHWLGRPHHPDQSPCYHWAAARSEHWLAALPEDGEALAAWLIPTLMHGADDGPDGGAWVLPGLAEAGGPAADAIHLALAYGLGARRAEGRLSAVDTLLVLAAQGRLDAGLLGRELAILVDHDLVKPNRLADSARTAAATGAYRTVLSVLTAALPSLLAYERAPHGLGDILAVAAACAERCGPVTSEPIAGLAATAGRRGSSQLVRQAARLLAASGPGYGGEAVTGDSQKVLIGARSTRNPSVTMRS
ncbi:DUF6493 family protein [Streptomyces sp. NPDC060022]|uniref:DUF6493 family protein n=1 Tax=Streptomyces sp. NPDC060022 TaxID=3347039 RepID=UPI0036B04846